MSTSTVLTLVPVTPVAPATQAAQATPSADAVLFDLAARRLALAADVDELTARLTPNNLAKVAGLKAHEKVQELRSQAVSKAEETIGQVKNRPASLTGGDTDPKGGVDTYDPSTLTLSQHISRLFDDTRNGDPASLGIVTVAGLTLADLSVTTTVTAVKAFRARAGRI